jgi:hypothetical protein
MPAPVNAEKSRRDPCDDRRRDTALYEHIRDGMNYEYGVGRSDAVRARKWGERGIGVRDSGAEERDQ